MIMMLIGVCIRFGIGAVFGVLTAALMSANGEDEE